MFEWMPDFETWGGDVTQAVSPATGDVSGGFWGGITAKDLVGTTLGAWSAIEGQKQSTRLAETELQARLWGIPTKYQNPQAGTASQLGGAVGQSNLLMWAGLGLVAWLLFKAAK